MTKKTFGKISPRMNLPLGDKGLTQVRKTQMVCTATRDITVTGWVTPIPCGLLPLQAADLKDHGL